MCFSQPLFLPFPFPCSSNDLRRKKGHLKVCTCVGNILENPDWVPRFETMQEFSLLPLKQPKPWTNRNLMCKLSDSFRSYFALESTYSEKAFCPALLWTQKLHLIGLYVDRHLIAEDNCVCALAQHWAWGNHCSSSERCWERKQQIWWLFGPQLVKTSYFGRGHVVNGTASRSTAKWVRNLLVLNVIVLHSHASQDVFAQFLLHLICAGNQRSLRPVQIFLISV